MARRLLRSAPSITLARNLSVGAELLKDPYAVLRQKEQAIARVRNEIRALLAVIPLLSDSPPSWQEMSSQIEITRFCREHKEEFDSDVSDLERYFPFTRDLQAGH